MIRPVCILAAIMLISFGLEPAHGELILFDQSAWATGDMNEQYPADSNGSIGNSHLDYFYYHERIPMCQTSLDDSLAAGSPDRTYDSALLVVVVASSGLSGADSMILFGKRLTRPWSENGTSWDYHHASSDSAWDNAGGDVNGLPCTDTLIIDATTAVYDTLYFRLDTGFVRALVENNNYGWLMMAENVVDRATFQIYTEDTGNESDRPVLTVYYSETEPPPAVLKRRRRTAF